MVKYCNAACKKKHRSKHKKACERRVAELYDEELFKDVEPEECPICMLPLPLDSGTSTFMSCCGKTICNGCIYAMLVNEGVDIPMCILSNAAKNVKRAKQLIDRDNADAFYVLANAYSDGIMGMPQDYQKAIELFLKAGELGCAEAYCNLGNSYFNGYGVKVDTKKAQHYYEQAAMMGCVDARYHLGHDEYRAGNYRRGMNNESLLIGARAGHEESLDAVKEGFMKKWVTKCGYADTLRAYQTRQNEMKSDERDKAVATDMISFFRG